MLRSKSVKKLSMMLTEYPPPRSEVFFALAVAKAKADKANAANFIGPTGPTVFYGLG